MAIKEEEVDLAENGDYTEAQGSLRRFLKDVYVRKRIDSVLGYLTPPEFAERWHGKHRRLHADHQKRPNKNPVSGVHCSTSVHTVEGAYADAATLPNTMARSVIMRFLDYRGTQIEVDEDGFLADPSLWNEDLASFLAEQEEGITDLTQDHWKVIYYLNRYYKEFGVAPMIRLLCKETDFKLRYIYELFPSGPARGACKVAGLPKPTGCV